MVHFPERIKSDNDNDMHMCHVIKKAGPAEKIIRGNKWNIKNISTLRCLHVSVSIYLPRSEILNVHVNKVVSFF